MIDHRRKPTERSCLPRSAPSSERSREPRRFQLEIVLERWLGQCVLPLQAHSLYRPSQLFGTIATFVGKTSGELGTVGELRFHQQHRKHSRHRRWLPRQTQRRLPVSAQLRSAWRHRRRPPVSVDSGPYLADPTRSRTIDRYTRRRRNTRPSRVPADRLLFVEVVNTLGRLA